MMRQTVLTVLLIVLILATGLVWFRYLREPPSSTTPSEPVLDRAVLDPYLQLKNLNLDTSLFSDPSFRVLERPRSIAPITPAGRPGRPNPFAPF